MNNKTYLLLDTETTGLGDNDQIVEISIVDHLGNVLFDSLIKPSVPVCAGAQETHNISPDDLAKAPSWPDVYHTVSKILTGANVVAWFCDFDARMIKQTSAAYGLNNIECTWFCGKRYFSSLINEYDHEKERIRRFRLTEAADRLGIDMATINGLGAHRSLFDTLLTQKVLKTINFNLDCPHI